MTARMPIPSRRSRGAAITGVPGIAGAPPGRQSAIGLLRIRSLQAFFKLPAWPAAVGGAATLLPASHLTTGLRGRRGHG